MPAPSADRQRRRPLPYRQNRRQLSWLPQPPSQPCPPRRRWQLQRRRSCPTRSQPSRQSRAARRFRTQQRSIPKAPHCPPHRLEPDHRVRDVIWTNPGLGCPQPGMVCKQVPFDGLLIRLESGGQLFDYHSVRPPSAVSMRAAG